MHVTDKSRDSPTRTPHGEVIYELIGRSHGDTSPGHSLAHIVIPTGRASRKHYHPLAKESYTILAGQGVLLLGEETQTLRPGETVLIPPTVVHQISNQGDADLELLAICVPAWEPTNSVYLDEG